MLWNKINQCKRDGECQKQWGVTAVLNRLVRERLSEKVREQAQGKNIPERTVSEKALEQDRVWHVFVFVFLMPVIFEEYKGQGCQSGGGRQGRK